MIRCDGVTARNGPFWLRDITFTVPEGGYALLTGPSASGKTTLLEVIAGAVIPIRGSVWLGHGPAGDLPIERRGLGLVHQHGYLFPHLSVSENVAYGAHDASTATELVQRFGITHLTGRDVATLSGGERQLVALCRALAARPRILLLDEPFSALDHARRSQVSALVAAIHREWRLTTLVVSHEERDTLGAITQRLHVAAGRLVQQPTRNATCEPT